MASTQSCIMVLLLWQTIYKGRKLIKISITSLDYVLLHKYSVSLNFYMICSDSCESITPYENLKNKAFAKASHYMFYFFLLAN